MPAVGLSRRPERQQPADLVDEALRHHPVHPQLDPLVQVGAVEAEVDGVVDRVEAGHRRGERAAGDLDDLERPHDAPAVGRQDRRGGGRVELGQPGVQGRRASLVEFGVEAGADRRRLAGELEVVERAAQVQPGAADEDRQRGRGRRSRRCTARASCLVLGDRGGLLHRPDVEQVMRDAAPLGLGQLRGADVHAAVELHRVGVDDLAAERSASATARSDLPVAVGPTTAMTRRHVHAATKYPTPYGASS